MSYDMEIDLLPVKQRNIVIEAELSVLHQEYYTSIAAKLRFSYNKTIK